VHSTSSPPVRLHQHDGQLLAAQQPSASASTATRQARAPASRASGGQ
jgi:hypothetical protein